MSLTDIPTFLPRRQADHADQLELVGQAEEKCMAVINKVERPEFSLTGDEAEIFAINPMFDQGCI